MEDPLDEAVDPLFLRAEFLEDRPDEADPLLAWEVWEEMLEVLPHRGVVGGVTLVAEAGLREVVLVLFFLACALKSHLPLGAFILLSKSQLVSFLASDRGAIMSLPQ